MIYNYNQDKSNINSIKECLMCECTETNDAEFEWFTIFDYHICSNCFENMSGVISF